MAKMTRRSRTFAAVGAGCIAAGALAAAAASLGTLTIDQLGTSAGIVAACQTSGLTLNSWGQSLAGVTMSGTTSPSSTQGSTYSNVSVVVTNFSGTRCNGQAFKLAFLTSTGATVTETSGTISGVSSSVGQTINYTPGVDSKSQYQAVLTIYGPKNLAG